MSLWLALVGNLPLWQRLWAIPMPVRAQGISALALTVISVGLVAVLLGLLAWPRVLRVWVSLWVLVTALAFHFMTTYGVVIDSSMLVNALNTDAREATDLLSPRLLWTLVLVAGPPLGWVWRTPLVFAPTRLQWRRNGMGLLLGLVLAAAALLAGFQSLAPLMREHKSLRYMINPLASLYAVGQWLGHHAQGPVGPLQVVGEDARLGASYASQPRPPLWVIVVGETARAQNWGLNGRHRDTTPRLAHWQEGEGLVNFPEVRACGTNTQVSLPCLFSPLARADGGNQPARHENLLDVLQRAGLAVLWLDNQSGCKGVCDRVPHASTRSADLPGVCADGVCFDEVLLQGLDGRIAALDPQRRARGVVLVLHLMGSHGPAYHRRVPEAHRRFQPVCTQTTLSDCSAPALTNAYDNTLAYTDHVLDQTLTWLQQQAQEGRYDTGLLYVSDHGESLGENGLYLHGMPYLLAPEEQTRVPMVTWLSPGMQQRRGVRSDCLRERAASPLSHDHVFHSVLGVMDVQTAVYRPGLDLFEPCSGR